MTYIAVVDHKYPTSLAICFLKEVQNEFSGRYDSRDIAQMRRPYSCIEFNEDINRMIKRYNRPQSLTTKLNLQEINKDLMNDPLKHLTLSDIETKAYNSSNVKIQSNSKCEGVGPPPPLEPLNWYHNILMLINGLFAVLSLYRSFEFETSSGIGDEDEPSFALLFGLHALTSSLQTMFLIKPKFRNNIYLFNINFIACMYTLYQIQLFSDPVLIVVNFIVSVGLHILTFFRSYASKKPQSMV